MNFTKHDVPFATNPYPPHP